MARRPGARRPPGAVPKPAARPSSRKPAGRAFWLVLVLLVAALAGQLRLTVARLGASRTVFQIEMRSKAAQAAGRASRLLFAENLRILRRAAELDPLEVRVPLLRGTQHFLLGSPEAAEEAYLDALRLEPQAEIYLNLGNAQLKAGTPEAARKSFGTAVTLDPKLAKYIPANGR